MKGGTKVVSMETNPVRSELKSRREKVVKQLTIHKYMHIQFIKLGFIVGIALVLLGAFAAFEGIKLTQYEAEKYNTSQGLQITLTIVVVSVVVVGIIVVIDKVLNRVVKKILQRIGEPVQIMDEVMSNLAGGKLEDNFSYDMEDEFSNMVSNAGSAVKELKKYIDNITDTLHEMEERNMDVTVDQEYIGDFAEIRTSMLSIIDSLNVTLYEMRASFMQVRMAPILSQRPHSLWRMGRSSSPYILKEWWIRSKKCRNPFIIIRWRHRMWRGSPRTPWREWQRERRRWMSCPMRWIRSGWNPMRLPASSR